MCFSYLCPEEIEVLTYIYLGRGSTINGGRAKDLYRRLKQVQEDTHSLECDFLVSFEKEAAQSAEKLKTLQEKVKGEFIEKFRGKLSYKIPTIDF